MAEVIVALDLPSAGRALELVDRLPELRWAKVGPILFLRDGPALVRELKQRGVRVFLDLKWHDIPSAVAGAAEAAAGLGVDLASLHALGGEAMLRAAVETCGEMRLAAVTVLTSHTAATYGSVVGRSSHVGLESEVVRLAQLATAVGIHGVVVSPLEAAAVRAALGPQPWVVVPGIRPRESAGGDQRRTADPAVAVAAGATHLVVGRPVIRAKNPRAVYEEICQAAAL